MQVKVQYLGILREFAGRESDALEVRENSSLGQIYEMLQQQIPQLAEFRQALAMAVNFEYSGNCAANKELRRTWIGRSGD